MGVREEAGQLGCETNAALAAAESISDAYEDLKAAAREADGFEGAESVREFLEAGMRLHDLLRLFRGSYAHDADRLRWERRLRSLVRELKPIAESDAVVESLRSPDAADGRQVAAFLIGRELVLREAHASAARSRLERLDLERIAKGLERFARTSTGGPAGEVALRELAAAALAKRVNVVLGFLGGGFPKDDWKALHSVSVSCRKVVAVLNVSASCYDADSLAAARMPFEKLGDAAARLRGHDAALARVREHAISPQARMAGVTDAGLKALIAALERKRGRVRLDAEKLASAFTAEEIGALVFAPLAQCPSPGETGFAPEAEGGER